MTVSAAAGTFDSMRGSEAADIISYQIGFCKVERVR